MRSGVNSARQMAWGDKGTLFVGSFGAGTVYAIVDNGGKKEVKPILKGMKMPTGVAFRDGALYVVDIDKILKYENAEANLDKMPEPKVVYDDMPPYVPHGWKYLAFDKDGWLYVPFGPPCNVCLPPTSLAQIRRVNPATGEAELDGDRRAQQRRRRHRPAHRRLLVHRECARLDQRRPAERQAEPHRQASARTTAIRTATRATCSTRSTARATSAPSSRRRCSSSARTWRRWA